MNTVTVSMAIGLIVGLACIVGYLADSALTTQTFPKDQP
jgi:hypothetical protein